MSALSALPQTKQNKAHCENILNFTASTLHFTTPHHTMSLFKTLQHQPRIITLFTHDISSKPSTALLQRLQGDASDKFNIEVHTRFPTLDQLKYMYGINKSVLADQINGLSGIISKPSQESVFNQDLAECVRSGVWNKNKSLWVDWEKKIIGDDVGSLKALLKK